MPINDKSDPQDPNLTDDEREANRRFQEAVGRLVNTPHTPHKPPQAKDDHSHDDT